MRKDGKMDSQGTTTATAGLYAAAALLRFVLFAFFPGLPDLLTARDVRSTRSVFPSFRLPVFPPCQSVVQPSVRGHFSAAAYIIPR